MSCTSGMMVIHYNRVEVLRVHMQARVKLCVVPESCVTSACLASVAPHCVCVGLCLCVYTRGRMNRGCVLVGQGDCVSDPLRSD